jgi:hypothetical protein
MNLTKLLAIIIILFPLVLFAQSETNTPSSPLSKRTISVELEYGAGHMVTVSGELGNLLIKKLNFGVSLGFDKGEYEVLNSKFNEYLLNVSGLVSYNLLRLKTLDIIPYTRVGIEYYFMSSYSAGTFFFAPGIKLGYDIFFLDLAFPTVWGLEKPIFVLQLGGGLKFRFDLKN